MDGCGDNYIWDEYRDNLKLEDAQLEIYLKISIE
jgi:hypothetical protein